MMKRTAHAWAEDDQDFKIMDHAGWRDVKNFNQNYFTKYIERDEYVSRRNRSTIVPKPQTVEAQVLKTASEWNKLDKVWHLHSYSGWKDVQDFQRVFYHVPITWKEYSRRRGHCSVVGKPET